MSKHRENCPYAYRKNGKNTVFCHLFDGNPMWQPYCAKQYFCNRTMQVEAVASMRDCPYWKEAHEKATTTTYAEEKPKTKKAKAKAEEPAAETEE